LCVIKQSYSLCLRRRESEELKTEIGREGCECEAERERRRRRNGEREGTQTRKLYFENFILQGL